MSPNEARMYDLIEDVFNTGNDPTQLGFNESDIEKLIALSPHTLQEASNEDGPYAWVSVFLMKSRRGKFRVSPMA